MRQKIFNFLSKHQICISSIALITSLIAAPFLEKNGVGANLLVGSVALLTPIWFIWDWADNPHGSSCSDKSTQENFKYSQGLAKNVWIALVAVLSVITGVVGFK